MILQRRVCDGRVGSVEIERGSSCRNVLKKCRRFLSTSADRCQLLPKCQHPRRVERETYRSRREPRRSQQPGVADHAAAVAVDTGLHPPTVALVANRPDESEAFAVAAAPRDLTVDESTGDAIEDAKKPRHMTCAVNDVSGDRNESHGSTFISGSSSFVIRMSSDARASMNARS